MYHIVLEQHLVVGTILSLVAIDKYEVVLLAQLRSKVESRADVLAYFIAQATALEEVGCNHLQLVIYLEGVDVCTLLQARSHRECRVTREGANFEYSAWAQHTHKHFEKLALNMSRNHSWVDYTQVCFTL